MANDVLPKQELLAKMLHMTTSDNDAQALVAIRKANELLASAGWDWDRLLAGKIRVVADPFASVPAPPAGTAAHHRPTPSTPMRPTQPQHAPYSTAAPPKPQPPSAFERAMQAEQVRIRQENLDRARRQAAETNRRQHLQLPRIGSIRKNAYPNTCFCCGIHVPVHAGFIFQPRDFVTYPDKWEVVCPSCNASPSPSLTSTKARGQTRTIYPASGPTPDLNNL